MSGKIKLNANSGGGSVSIQAPSSSSNNRVITLPDIADGDLLTSQSSLSSAKLTGALPAIDGSALTGLGGGVPSGCILIWSGASNAIPTGYVLCDGNNSTPNLAGKFVVGYHASNGDYDVGDTGGAETVTLTEAQMPSHVHHFLIQDGSTSPMGYAQSANGTNSIGSSQAHENRPPFYALCYIMKT